MNPATETNPILARLIRQMVVRSHWALVPVLVAALTAGTVACPLWMSLLSHCATPCSNANEPSNECPISICQVGSPYLTSHANAEMLQLEESTVDLLDWRALWTSFAGVNTIRREHGAPPGAAGPVFLRTHSLLI